MNRLLVCEADPEREQAIAGLEDGAASWTDALGLHHVADGRGCSGMDRTWQGARRELNIARAHAAAERFEAASSRNAKRVHRGAVLFWVVTIAALGWLLTFR